MTSTWAQAVQLVAAYGTAGWVGLQEPRPRPSTSPEPADPLAARRRSGAGPVTLGALLGRPSTVGKKRLPRPPWRETPRSWTVTRDGVTRSPGAGWQHVHVDDHSRLAYAEVRPSDRQGDALAFLDRALAWFRWCITIAPEHRARLIAPVTNVHLGRTRALIAAGAPKPCLVPYATLDPLKAVLPLRNSDGELPIDPDGVGGIRLGGLERRMRDRWRTVSGLWDENKAAANKLSLLGQLDYYGKLSAQLEWKQNPGDRRVRVVYTQAGQPTAALLEDDEAIVDTRLYWIACRDIKEAYYLLAVINSEALYASVRQFMSKGQFGARDLHKQLWKLPIREFDPDQAIHLAIADAGWAAEAGAQRQLDQMRADRGRVSVTVARRELRRWLRSSPEGQAVETAVETLLS